MSVTSEDRSSTPEAQHNNFSDLAEASEANLFAPDENDISDDENSVNGDVEMVNVNYKVSEIVKEII